MTLRFFVFCVNECEIRKHLVMFLDSKLNFNPIQDGEAQKGPPNSFSTASSTKKGISPQIF